MRSGFHYETGSLWDEEFFYLRFFFIVILKFCAIDNITLVIISESDGARRGGILDIHGGLEFAMAGDVLKRIIGAYSITHIACFSTCCLGPVWILQTEMYLVMEAATATTKNYMGFSLHLHPATYISDHFLLLNYMGFSLRLEASIGTVRTVNEDDSRLTVIML
ncbi:hypothetical protein ACJX0J_035921 [Zea mays]